MLKRALIGVGDPLRAAAEPFIRAGFACRTGARQDVFPLIIVGTRGEIPPTAGLPLPADASQQEAFANASPVFVIGPKEELNTGLVHAETI
jgi:hypothetical protein